MIEVPIAVAIILSIGIVAALFMLPLLVWRTLKQDDRIDRLQGDIDAVDTTLAEHLKMLYGDRAVEKKP